MQKTVQIETEAAATAKSIDAQKKTNEVSEPSVTFASGVAPATTEATEDQ